MAIHLDRSRSDALCTWLTAHSIEPNTVPTDADMAIVDTDDGRVLRCEVLVLTADGRPVLDDRGDRAAIETRAVPLVAESPEWWTPYEKPTREQLAAAADRVRALHVRNPHSGTCEHCSAGDYPDYSVPHPCATIRALNGEQP